MVTTSAPKLGALGLMSVTTRLLDCVSFYILEVYLCLFKTDAPIGVISLSTLSCALIVGLIVESNQINHGKSTISTATSGCRVKRAAQRGPATPHRSISAMRRHLGGIEMARLSAIWKHAATS